MSFEGCNIRSALSEKSSGRKREKITEKGGGIGAGKEMLQE